MHPHGPYGGFDQQSQENQRRYEESSGMLGQDYVIGQMRDAQNAAERLQQLEGEAAWRASEHARLSSGTAANYSGTYPKQYSEDTQDRLVSVDLRKAPKYSYADLSEALWNWTSHEWGSSPEMPTAAQLEHAITGTFRLWVLANVRVVARQVGRVAPRATIYDELDEQSQFFLYLFEPDGEDDIHDDNMDYLLRTGFDRVDKFITLYERRFGSYWGGGKRSSQLGLDSYKGSTDPVLKKETWVGREQALLKEAMLIIRCVRLEKDESKQPPPIPTELPPIPRELLIRAIQDSLESKPRKQKGKRHKRT